MLRIVLQKMLHNSWMVVCLAVGSLLAVAFISSVPMYTGGIMQRMLVRDLEQFQVNRNIYPGTISAKYNFYNPQPDPSRIAFYNYVNNNIESDLLPGLNLEVLETTRHLTLDYLLCTDPERPDDENRRANLKIVTMMGMTDHIDITHGRMYDPIPKNGVYEVIASKDALISLDMVMDRTYQVSNMLSDEEIFQIRIVGIFTIKETSDLFWFNQRRDFATNLFIDYDTFEKDFVAEYASNLTYIKWFYALNYKDIRVENLPGFLQILDNYKKLARENKIDFSFAALSIFDTYAKRAQTLNIILLFLQIPVLLMLIFFIYMVSQLVINNERNEMAVLKSRGAGGGQIFNIYLTEGLILGIAALIAGPLCGFIICSLLGSANGFMEFVQRVALPVRLSLKAYIFALMGFAIFLITMLLPVMFFSRSSIVEHKQKKVRKKKKIFWKRFFLDVILIGISAYGLYSYKTRQEVLLITGAEGSNLPVDPMLFGISVLFILGSGMLFLRIFPFLVNILFRLGRKIWKPSTYAAFIQVGRSEGVQQFLMIFLILSFAIGIFNSTAARTINRNTEDKIEYRVGADIVIKPYWKDLNEPESLDGPGLPDGMAEAPTASFSSGPQYVEPSFDEYLKLEGVETATKVFRQTRASIKLPGSKSGSAELMGIIPNEFAEAAWFRRDLLPYHWFNYLNLLAHSPRAILVSTSMQEAYDLNLGDSVMISWKSQSSIEGIIYAFIDYWPSINPREKTANRPGGAGHQFIVANLSFIHAKMAIEPYEVWVTKKPDAASAEIFSAIEESSIEVLSITDAQQEIIAAKNDPMLQGINGVLTLGFLVSIVIAIAGFVIYWILSLKSRVLQFGIIRAMGMEKKYVTRMLVWEHIMTSGTAIVLGIIIGRIAGYLFIPLIQLVYASAEQVPPFRIVNLPKDFLQIYIIGFLMIIVGIMLFRVIISRLNVHQALKIGED